MDLSRAAWRRSSRSSGQGNCVEVADNLADAKGIVLVRDSKNPTGPCLRFTSTEWTAFVGGVNAGAFDPI